MAFAQTNEFYSYSCVCSFGGWSESGLTTSYNSSTGEVTCSSNHLTSFSILVSVSQVSVCIDKRVYRERGRWKEGGSREGEVERVGREGKGRGKVEGGVGGRGRERGREVTCTN